MGEEIKVIYGDGVTDDTEALQNLLDGGQCICPNGEIFDNFAAGKFYRVDSTLNFKFEDKAKAPANVKWYHKFERVRGDR